jgi:hypothetical protein
MDRRTRGPSKSLGPMNTVWMTTPTAWAARRVNRERAADRLPSHVHRDAGGDGMSSEQRVNVAEMSTGLGALGLLALITWPDAVDLSAETMTWIVVGLLGCIGAV